MFNLLKRNRSRGKPMSLKTHVFAGTIALMAVVGFAGPAPAQQSDVFYNHGNAYARKGQYDLAIQDYNQAIKLNPNNVNAITNRGNAYFSKGQYDLAIQDYNQALKLNPNDVDVINNRAVAIAKKKQ